jgi:polyisoprenoid-binding protein YceI
VEKTTLGQSSASTSTARRNIDLDIAGDDFMLQGSFSDWESGLAFGPDLDRVRVRLAIDATSAEAADAPNLFTFHARQVESLGSGRYRVIGTFTGPRGGKAMEMTVESPPGHTALIVVTFAAKKQDFGDGWHDLIEKVVPFGEPGEGAGDGPVRSAHAWLVPPPLAAA